MKARVTAMDSWRNGTGGASAGSPAAGGAGRVYSAGIYARLSVEGSEKKNGSIENQIAIAKAYLERQPDMVLYGCYTDLGKTGTNFRREGFQGLMADVRMRRVDCVIVKDFSRFGRNYIETGNYIQKIFPFLGVRFISVTDGFDSRDEDTDDWSMNLKNLANELYARDIAVKVKSARKAQWESGSYTGGIPPYGYRAEWRCGIKRLVTEEGTSDLVKEMYRRYGEGSSLKEIAAWLYGETVHRPTEYRRFGHMRREEGEELRAWTEGTIRLILTNPVYIGCLVQGRTCGKAYEKGKRHAVPTEDWTVREGTHEAIVPKELFFRVADRFEGQAKYGSQSGRSGRMPQEADLFRGILFCGQCGRGMARRSHGKELGSGHKVRLYGYYCRQASGIGVPCCESISISCRKLTSLVKTALRQEYAISGVKAEDLEKCFEKAAAERRRGLEQERRAAEKAMEDGRRRGSDLYLRYRNGEIGREAFQEWREKEERQNGKRKAGQEEIDRKMKETDAEAVRQKRLLRAMLAFGEASPLSRDLLAALVEKIVVWPDRRMQVFFRFRSLVGASAVSGDFCNGFTGKRGFGDSGETQGGGKA